MTTSATLFQTLLDLWLSVLKLLGRPAVQGQLLAAVAALALAWLLARSITGAMRRRYAARAALVREQIAAEARQRPAEAADEEEEGEYALLLTNESQMTQMVDRRMSWQRRIHLLALQMVLPLLIIVLLLGAYLLFDAAGWYSGLLLDLVSLAGLFLAYRLFMGLAYMFGNEARVTHYRNRLFGPVFTVWALLLALNAVGDINALANATILPLEQGWLTLGGVFLATFGFYVWVMVLSLVKDLITAIAGRGSVVDRGSLDAVLTLAQYGLIAIGLFGVFRALQLNPATVAAITGGLAIGVGFALQDILRNFLGGIIVLFEGAVRPGDWVEVAGTEGEIDKLNIRSTTVRTADNIEYIVPNQDWFARTLKTFTRSSRSVRARIPIGVSNKANPRTVQRVLVETVRQHPDVMAEPLPMAPLVNFGASTINFEVFAWVEDARIKDRVVAEVRLLLWDALRAHEIGMA
jgi:potassium efflux system protein